MPSALAGEAREKQEDERQWYISTWVIEHAMMYRWKRRLAASMNKDRGLTGE
jgi:hypothetical protein